MNKIKILLVIVVILAVAGIGQAEKSDNDIQIVETVAGTAEAGVKAVAGTAEVGVKAVAGTAEATSRIVYNFWRYAYPATGFFGFNDKLDDYGMEFGAGLTTVYQTNTRGGTSTNDRRGRHVGRYDLEMSMDLEKLLGIEGGTFFIHGWGGWPNTEGVDGHSVGSAWGINALSVGNRGLDIVEAFYEGPFFSDNLTVSVGKLDSTTMKKIWARS